MKEIINNYKEIRLTKNAIRALIFVAQKKQAGPYDFYREKFVSNPKEAYTAFKTIKNAKFIRNHENSKKKFFITSLGLSFLDAMFGLGTLGIRAKETTMRKIFESLMPKR